MAYTILQGQGDEKLLGKRWVVNFKKRNPRVKTLIGKRMDATRIEGATSDNMAAYFERLDAVCRRLNIKTGNVYNFDETGTATGARYHHL